MSEEKIQEIADKAEMIVAGYAFTKKSPDFVQVLNLYNPEEACLLQSDGKMVETTMDDISILKVQACYLKNKEFMEVHNA